MRVSVIVGHPNPKSFNHALAQAVRDELLRLGHQVVFHDLQAEGFDALLPAAELAKDAALEPVVQGHCQELQQAEGIVIVHPNWWGMPPAVLKGWLDRVWRQGVAYHFAPNDKGEIGPVGLLKIGPALVITTSNTPAEQEKALYGDPLENLWRRCILGFCGISQVTRKNFEVVITSTPQQRMQWLIEARRLTEQAFAG